MVTLSEDLNPSTSRIPIPSTYLQDNVLTRFHKQHGISKGSDQRSIGLLALLINSEYSSYRDWSALPQDLLVLIARKLCLRNDLVALSQVCKPWCRTLATYMDNGFISVVSPNAQRRRVEYVPIEQMCWSECWEEVKDLFEISESTKIEIFTYANILMVWLVI
ncbi:hypothetical protein GOP47_0024460 [Adiantum capillus-veneris]|uniref:F-box domain-containing protein n=1 Tax=Adiantum capillus-veneris TaxID=13818 RepID=A0A9D4Z3P2_ADICA|nr:hypothetical protein GOP47_0024460 [Adiantum capillus-veneris]